MNFDYVNDYFLENATEEELGETTSKMESALSKMNYDSDEYLQLDLLRVDVSMAIASRFPLNIPYREHGWYLPNDD